MGKKSKAGRPVSQRQLRVGEEIRHILSDVFLRSSFYLKEYKTVSITVSEVQVSPDLRQATVFISMLAAKESMIDEIVKLLNVSEVHQLNALLGKVMHLKFTPRLLFKADKSFEQADKIEQLLKQQ